MLLLNIHFTFQTPSLLSPEAQFLVSAGCENGFPNSSGSSMASHRPQGFKSLSSRPSSASPAAPHAHTAFMSPHSGEKDWLLVLLLHCRYARCLCLFFTKSTSTQDHQMTKGPWIPHILAYNYHITHMCVYY